MFRPFPHRFVGSGGPVLSLKRLPTWQCEHTESLCSGLIHSCLGSFSKTWQQWDSGHMWYSKCTAGITPSAALKSWYDLHHENGVDMIICIGWRSLWRKPVFCSLCHAGQNLCYMRNEACMWHMCMRCAFAIWLSMPKLVGCGL
jgi:hypothetical protein